MATDICIRPADPAERGYAESLLAANDLPVEDLPEDLEWLYCCEVDGERVGVGGLQRRGDHALVRSVAIAESARGEGYGRALWDRLLAEAADEGVESVYLLTTTASGFFSSLGFERVERESAPESLRETPEFDDLCPDAAVCMRREVDP
ncbi:arsenic resistance N-acetyltransferase ArsN2 [Halorussus marinus]|uniref:arsenic resistance N-acetyltransferase ArsN2 n=1 Tax=Halorussus marinus TaxID=2505976 RepID=UPI001091B7BF|nr:arsenic resistance N-acetyltransferase ArsN2 [Halorussus marinus]